MSESPREVVSFNDRVSQFNMAREIVQTGVRRWKAYKSSKEAALRYYVTVEDDDPLYEKIQQWLLKDLDRDDQRSVVVETSRDYDGDSVKYELMLMTESDYSSEVNIDGTWVEVEITSKHASDKRGSGSEQTINDILSGSASLGTAAAASSMMGGQASTFNKRAIFTCRNKAERDAVLSKLGEMVNAMHKQRRIPGFYTALGYGGWRRTTTVMRRPLDAVILAGDTKERIVADLENFLKTEQRYIDLGLPWHHGYLFEGPPGTGKTSVAAALASKFEFDVYYIPLSTIESDAKLMECVSGVDNGKAVLVMEDVDIVNATRERNNDTKGVTLQGLLNALDGIATPHGLITIMTTNDKSVLDPALIRPGRVDMDVHIGYVNDDQLQRLCDRFIGRRVENLPHLVGEISPAEIVGIFKAGDHAGVDDALRSMIEEANLRVTSGHDNEKEEMTSASRESGGHSPSRPHGPIF